MSKSENYLLLKAAIYLLVSESEHNLLINEFEHVELNMLLYNNIGSLLIKKNGAYY